jgi:hypothetical protein
MKCTSRLRFNGGGKFRAPVESVSTLAAFVLLEASANLVPLRIGEGADRFGLRFETQSALGLLASGDPDISDGIAEIIRDFRRGGAERRAGAHDWDDRWTMEYDELREALKRGREASDERVVDSLYRLAIGWNGQAPNLGACSFWLKNRRPSEWRDVQHLDQAVGHYIISDKPMTEAEWIAARADAAKPVKALDDAGAGRRENTQTDIEP